MKETAAFERDERFEPGPDARRIQLRDIDDREGALYARSPDVDALMKMAVVLTEKLFGVTRSEPTSDVRLVFSEVCLNPMDGTNPGHRVTVHLGKNEIEGAPAHHRWDALVRLVAELEHRIAREIYLAKKRAHELST
jgi:hypothetical protein